MFKSKATGIAVFFIIILLIGGKSTHGDTKIYYQPLFLPFSIGINPEQGFSFELSPNIQTPWGEVGLEQEFTLSFEASLGERRQMSARPHTRIWVEPTVRNWNYEDVVTGTSLWIIGDPVVGPIKADSDLQGEWYPVSKSANGTLAGCITPTKNPTTPPRTVCIPASPPTS